MGRDYIVSLRIVIQPNGQLTLNFIAIDGPMDSSVAKKRQDELMGRRGEGREGIVYGIVPDSPILPPVIHGDNRYMYRTPTE
jgi:hypothetical protein